MSLIDKTLESILAKPSEARKIHEAFVTGKVARVTGGGNKQYLVFTSEAASHVKKIKPSKS